MAVSGAPGSPTRTGGGRVYPRAVHDCHVLAAVDSAAMLADDRPGIAGCPAREAGRAACAPVVARAIVRGWMARPDADAAMAGPMVRGGRRRGGGRGELTPRR